jgi:hypothetical protein
MDLEHLVDMRAPASRVDAATGCREMTQSRTLSALPDFLNFRRSFMKQDAQSGLLGA